MTRQWPSTSRAEDAAVLALADLTRAAAGSQYRVIGGNMTTFHAARRQSRIAPRSTADADAGIESSAVAATDLTEALVAVGYARVDGSRFIRHDGELDLIIDLLVPDVHAEEHNIEVGPLSADAAPGLTLALSRPPLWVEYSVLLTSGQAVDLTLPLPDGSAAVVMKVLAWRQRMADKDALDTFRLLDTWAQDVAAGDVLHPLRAGVTVMRAVDVLQRYFVPPRGKATLLPKPFQTAGRQAAAQFISWVGVSG